MELIDKDVVVAELKKRIDDYWSDSENTMGIYPYALEEVIKYLDTLEVKEVDLEKEIKSFTEGLFHKVFDEDKSQDDFDWDDIATVIEHTAKHFFELGLKTTKEE